MGIDWRVSSGIPLTMHSVVETPGYLKDVEGIFTAEERFEIVTMVATDPECGDVVPGTGGVRKVRFARGGRGKSAGGRVIYVYYDANHRVFLLAAFAKNAKANLSQAERNALAKMVKTMFAPRREP